MRLDCILCDVVFDVSESRANAAAEAKAASSYPHFHAPLTDAMTNDGSSFLRQVQGQRFLAHKVIMSSASRWLAALLHDHNNALPIQLPQLSLSIAVTTQPFFPSEHIRPLAPEILPRLCHK